VSCDETGGAYTPLSNNRIEFTHAGTCSVTLNVKDATNETNSTSAVQITVTKPLETTLTANWTTISAGQTVFFTNITTGGTGGIVYQPYTIHWVSGSCSDYAQNGNNKLMFPNAGTCKVALKVSDATGEVNQSNVTITITPPLEVTSFTGTTPISLDQSAHFTNTTTGGTGSNLYSYSVFSGPGTITDMGNNNLKFSVAGTYVVQLQVTDLTHEVNTSTTTIVVNPELMLAPLPSPVNIDKGQNYTFTAIPSAGTAPYTYAWTLGSGLSINLGCGSSQTCNVMGTSTGTKTISVKLTDSSLGTPPENASSTSTVIVYPPLAVKPPTSSHSLVDQGQLSVESASVLGGVPPYTTYWSEEEPGNVVYTKIPASVQVSSYVITQWLFPTTTSTPIGDWEYMVNVSDSSSALPEMANAINQEGVTVYPQLLASVSANPTSLWEATPLP